MIHRKDKTLAVQLTPVDVKVRVPRRRKVLIRPWPVLHMSDWAKLCFENPSYNGFFLLGGHTLDTWGDAQAVLQQFWSRFGKVDGEMVPTYPSATVPLYIHGDEGRGLCKRPLLVVSFQPAMSWKSGNQIPSTQQLFAFSMWISSQKTDYMIHDDLQEV